MKKAFILICLLTVSLLVFSNTGKKNSDLELKTGFTRPLNLLDEEPKLGFVLEVRKIWYPEKQINIVSGIDLKNINYYVDWHPCGHGCWQSDLNYSSYSISVPLLARLCTGEAIKFYIEAGPEINYVPIVNLKADQVYTPLPTGDTQFSEISTNMANVGNKITFGLGVGAGLIIPIAGREYTLGSSYHTLLSHRSNGFNRHLYNFTVQVGIILK